MDEFAQMVKDVRAAKRISQGPDYSLTAGEKSSMAFRRSLFATKPIKKEKCLQKKMCGAYDPVMVLPRNCIAR